MLKDIFFILKIFAAYLIMSVSCFLMLRLIIGYTSFRDDVQFLLAKQDYIHNNFWKTAFYIHSFSAIICLFAGFTQFSSVFLKQNKKLHRLFGKIYVWNIFVINFPVGMVLAVYANGQLIGRAAFVLLDCLWFYFTYKAFIFARNKNFIAHKNYMMRSYALTFSAITLRTWHMILSHAFVIAPAHLYMIDAWLGFIPNLLLVELIIRYGRRTSETYGYYNIIN